VIFDNQKGRAKGVEITDTETNEVIEFNARIIFLNASTVATAYILLNSISTRFPNGLGNGSDQVGRNLMDHHKHVGASATVEGFEDQYYYGRRPTGIYVPRFRNLGEKRPDYIRGFGYQGAASRGGWESQLLTPSIGSSLKAAATAPGPWRIGLGAFGECLPYSKNRVTLNADVKDKWGRPTVVCDAEYKENEMASAMGEMLETVGYKNVKTYINPSFPGNANHEMGTARMGKSPKTSVLNAFNQMHEVENVFITDGSCMTSSSCVNPSLTYMALTARACDYAVRELNRLNL
jgi:choline dehydrogenase-like flavoprotein